MNLVSILCARDLLDAANSNLSFDYYVASRCPIVKTVACFEDFFILDFAQTISEVLTYSATSQLWQCTVCGKSNSDKARIRRHAEVHFKGFVHACQHCGVEKNTSTALRIHIHTYHGNK